MKTHKIWLQVDDLSALFMQQDGAGQTVGAHLMNASEYRAKRLARIKNDIQYHDITAANNQHLSSRIHNWPVLGPPR